MKRLIRFERRDVVRNAFNEQVGTWVELASAYAEWDALTGAEVIAAMQAQTRTSARVTCRYQDALADVSTKDRIALDGRTFDIQAAIDVGMRHREMQFLVAEQL